MQRFTHIWRRINNLLRASPLIRSLIYMLSLFASIETIYRATHRPHRYHMELLHIYSFPAVLGLTKLFQRFTHSKPRYSLLTPTPQEQRDLLKGAALAVGAGTAWTALAAAQGWLDFDAVEPQTHSELLEACVFHDVGHLTVALNEEMVIRGFLADTLQERLPPIPVDLGLCIFFALIHQTPFTWPKLLTHTTMGGTMILLRRSSGSIWMPIGYHWLWNVMKTVVVADQSVNPALFPFRNRGPKLWMGQPGTVHVGLLDFVIFAAMFGGLLEHYKRQASVDAH